LSAFSLAENGDEVNEPSTVALGIETSYDEAVFFPEEDRYPVGGEAKGKISDITAVAHRDD
jgi:hypothetical protein